MSGVGQHRLSTVVLLFLALVLGTGNAKPAPNRYDVEIVRDDFGVPHIRGKTDADTAYGLAYAASEDDFMSL